MSIKQLISVLAVVSALGAFLYVQFARAGQSDSAPTPVAQSQSGKVEVATFAGGCFWGIQDKFDKVQGVFNTTAGYTGGTIKNPSYQDVCTHTTGHAESVQVEFDPTVVTYQQLLDLFWKIHDPTRNHGQKPDHRDNYRSAVFYHSPEQKAAAEATMQKLNSEGEYKGLMGTEIVADSEFYPAEAYHQHYFKMMGITSPMCR